MAKEVVKQEIEISPNKKLVVTISWCKSCGICMELCPKEVLGKEEVKNATAVVFASLPAQITSLPSMS